jgi:hypothetical protein
MSSVVNKKNNFPQTEDQNYNYNNNNDDDDYDSEYECKKIYKNDILIEILVKIHNELVKYVSNGESRCDLVLPLCEFLCIDDIRYFLNNLE